MHENVKLTKMLLMIVCETICKRASGAWGCGEAP